MHAKAEKEEGAERQVQASISQHLIRTQNSHHSKPRLEEGFAQEGGYVCKKGNKR